MAVDPVAPEGARVPSAEAARRLYELYGNQIFAFSLSRLRNRQDAEDATQATFLNAFRALERGIVPLVELAWLLKIAERVVGNRRRVLGRRSRIEAPVELEVAAEWISRTDDGSEELFRLDDALATLGPQQRRAVLLREWQGLSYHEISEDLGISHAAVETLLFRARRQLAASLTDPDAPPKRGRLRRRLDIGGLLSGLKGLLGGGSAAKLVALVGTAAVGTVGVVGPGSPQPANAATPAPSVRAMLAHVPAARSAHGVLQPSTRTAVAIPADSAALVTASGLTAGSTMPVVDPPVGIDEPATIEPSVEPTSDEQEPWVPSTTAFTPDVEPVEDDTIQPVEEHVPPGQDPDFVPPGQAKKDDESVPPGQASTAVPPGQVKKDSAAVPPGQDATSVPPGQAKQDGEPHDPPPVNANGNGNGTANGNAGGNGNGNGNPNGNDKQPATVEPVPVTADTTPQANGNGNGNGKQTVAVESTPAPAPAVVEPTPAPAPPTPEVATPATTTPPATTNPPEANAGGNGKGKTK